jgi:L-ascorbate metabolism protein UlaG (beta-lactamase superfamily)
MIYHNLDPDTPRSLRAFLRWRIERRRLPPHPQDQAHPPDVHPNDGGALRNGDNTLTWVGHSSIVLQLDGLTILCDPVWSRRIPGGLVRRAGPGLALEDLPAPDFVVISHNHYDHLDLPTLRRLGPRTQLFVPAGLRRYFHARGFHNAREFDWWEGALFGQVRITFVPAQHWSSRTPWDTNRSWWGGWVFEGSRRIYFAGDTAYFSGFARIAERFPALDWALLPIGAYDPQRIMRPVHMNPEEAGAAFALLRATHMLPIHWGTFPLTDEPVREPPLRLRRWWSSHGLDPARLWIPALGETRQIAPVGE